jgi:hypothetical protein
VEVEHPSFQIMLAEVRGQYSLSPITNSTAPSVSFVFWPAVLLGPWS